MSGCDTEAMGPSSRPLVPDRVGIKRARILLVSDIRLYREGLHLSLQRRGALDILGSYDFSQMLAERISSLLPDVVILDMSAQGGFAMARHLNACAPSVKIVGFAVNETEQHILACAKAGVAGYVAPGASEEDLENAVNAALNNELSCSPRIAGLLFRRIGILTLSTPAPEINLLTSREREVLTLVSDGKSNKEIARFLHISAATVKNHVHNILDKLHVRRRGEAVAWLLANRSMASDDYLDPIYPAINIAVQAAAS